jgi:hypothetical protein
MGFSLRQANLFMCKARAISRGRRAAGYWNNIPGPEVRLSSQRLPARLGGTLCYYLASNFFAAAKRAPWAEHRQSCYSFIIKYTHLPDNHKKGGRYNQALLFHSSFPLTVLDLLEQTLYLSGLYIHVHSAKRRIGTGSRHQADGSGTGTEKFRAGIDKDVPDR